MAPFSQVSEPPQNPGRFNLTWLHDQEASESAIGAAASDFEHVDFNLPPHLGHAWVEKLVAGVGVSLFHGYHNLEKSPSQLLSLFEADIGVSEDPVFSAQIWLSGSGCHREYWHGRDCPAVDIVARPGRDTFRYHRGWQATVMIEGGVISEMKSMVVAVPTLVALIGEAATAMVLERLGLAGQAVTVVHSVPLHVGVPLREAMASRFRGPARRLQAQARVLDYLAGLYVFLAADVKPARERRHKARIRELHDYLLNLEGRLPSLDELAKSFGLSARHLNTEFSAEYGQSIIGFIADYRLDQAHAAIQEGSFSMKLLAARLGYSHVNHFIRAFKRKFGYPPGSLKNTGKQ